MLCEGGLKLYFMLLLLLFSLKSQPVRDLTKNKPIEKYSISAFQIKYTLVYDHGDGEWDSAWRLIK